MYLEEKCVVCVSGLTGSKNSNLITISEFSAEGLAFKLGQASKAGSAATLSTIRIYIIMNQARTYVNI